MNEMMQEKKPPLVTQREDFFIEVSTIFRPPYLPTNIPRDIWILSFAKKIAHCVSRYDVFVVALFCIHSKFYTRTFLMKKQRAKKKKIESSNSQNNT